jgi:dTDP-4-dehydrorhamnose 3,5-epimerase-like enzyme
MEGKHRRPCEVPVSLEVVQVANIHDVSLVDLPRIPDPRGNLTFLESEVQVPFAIQRVFYLYDVPGGETRAGHAHHSLQEFFIAASGSFDVVVDDGRQTATHSLRRSYSGLYVPGMLWRELVNFSSGSVCLVLCDQLYDPDDYIRDYDDYLKIATGSL